MIEYEIKVETTRQMNEEKIMKQMERQSEREKNQLLRKKEVFSNFLLKNTNLNKLFIKLQ